MRSSLMRPFFLWSVGHLLPEKNAQFFNASIFLWSFGHLLAAKNAQFINAAIFLLVGRPFIAGKKCAVH